MYGKITRMSLIASIFLLSGCATDSLFLNNLNNNATKEKKEEVKTLQSNKKGDFSATNVKVKPEMAKQNMTNTFSKKVLVEQPKIESKKIVLLNKNSIDASNEIKEKIKELKILPYSFITTTWEDIKKDINSFNKDEKRKLEELKIEIKKAKEESFDAESVVANNINRLEILYFKMYDLFRAKYDLINKKNQLIKIKQTKIDDLIKYPNENDFTTYKIIVNKIYFNNDTDKNSIKEYSKDLAEYKASQVVKKEFIKIVKETIDVDGKRTDTNYDKSMKGVLKDNIEFIYDDYEFEKQYQVLVSINKVKIESGKKTITEPTLPPGAKLKNDLGKNNGAVGLDSYEIDFELPTEPLIQLNQYVADTKYANNTFIGFEATLKMYSEKIKKYSNRIVKIDNQISEIDKEINNTFSSKNGLKNEFIQLKTSCSDFSNKREEEYNKLNLLNSFKYVQKYPIFDFIKNTDDKSANQLTQNLAFTIFDNTNTKLKSKVFLNSVLSTNYSWTNTKHNVGILPTVYSVDLYNRTHNTVNNISRYGLGEVFTINHKVEVTNLNQFKKPSVEECFNSNSYFTSRNKPLFKNLTVEKINHLEELHKNNVDISNGQDRYFNYLFNNYDKDEKRFIKTCTKGRIYGNGRAKTKETAIDKAKVNLVEKLYGISITQKSKLMIKCYSTNEKAYCEDKYEKYIKETLVGNIEIKKPIKVEKDTRGYIKATIKSKCSTNVYENIFVNKLSGFSNYLNKNK
ncbi:MAG: hypothetical protein U9N59_03475 [Campylobacterota bacterium]|nr:hypothetical protein [Campylobacterota bacterium]